jgi:hypothetical protein
MQQLQREGRHGQREAELATWGSALFDPAAQVPLLEGLARIDSLRQSGHPLKALTSGLERMTPTPFHAAGKWRMTERVAWWNDYDDVPAVVFGHYWRWPLDSHDADARARGPNLFTGLPPFGWLGARQNAMCVDWCVGLRWQERAEGVAEPAGRLGALRWDDRAIVLDR